MAYQQVSDEHPYSFYSDRRHQLKPVTSIEPRMEWRIKEKIKTVSVSLVLCLNIGVDPPDIVKTNPCAKMECWIDPLAATGQKTLEAIGRNLQSQYEAWQPRARYRLSLDPSIEETKKQCCSLRRNAKDERILFHYNGHGVPRPTASGEIWVFNKSYTQYIPVSIYDIQTWLGSPCMFVYDCSGAGHILNAFNKFLEQREAEADAAANRLSNYIQLAACGTNEVLPMSPDLPADLFTSCLTTPITIALRWYVLTNSLVKNITLDMAMKVPGKVTDRRTPLGELNWIFTSITDTIAWNVLPTELFLKLFRNDLMVAALFRNFLLADRIMRYYNCKPMSSPMLPPTHQHPMWEVWDLAVDQCLSQLPRMLEAQSFTDYKPCTFFADQLSAFEVWIKRAGTIKELPLQLPVVLQVLLSQIHRLRALLLLSKFLDFGQWAVELALSVGIFPYVSRLLQSPALELRSVLVFIWSKILAVDPSCRTDLLKDNGYTYFLGILLNNSSGAFQIANISEHKAMCVFILSVLCHEYLPGKQACFANDLLSALLNCITDQDSLLRQWVCVCLRNFWDNYPDAKWAAYNLNAHEKLLVCLSDPVPEVRAAAVFALGALFGYPEKLEQIVMIENRITAHLLVVLDDASPLVRKELVCTLSLRAQEDDLAYNAALSILEEERRLDKNTSPEESREGSSASFEAVDGQRHLISLVWKALLVLSVDPHPDVAGTAVIVVDKVYSHLNSVELVDASTLTYLQSHQRKFSSMAVPVMKEPIPSKRNSSKLYSASGIFKFSVESGEKTISSKLSSMSLRSLGSYVFGSQYVPDPLARHRHKPGSVNRRVNPNYPSSSTEIQSKSFSARDDFQPATEDSSKEKISLSSQFFEWCCDHFKESQMQLPEVDNPGSEQYWKRQWRSQRNKSINHYSSSLHHRGLSSVFDTHLKTVTHERNPVGRKTALFHSYESHLVVSDKTDISIIDWDEGFILNSIPNFNPDKSSICALKFINEEDSSILLAASSDGVVRLYKDYSDSDKFRLISAWKASNSCLPGVYHNLVCDWHQFSGTLFTSGTSSNIIKCFDADEEACVQELSVDAVASMTSLKSEPNGNLILCGFSDSSIKLFDRRLPPIQWFVVLTSAVATYQYGIGCCLEASFCNHESTEFLSANASGYLLLWDIRSVNPILKIETVSGPLIHFATHAEAPLMATFNDKNVVNVMNFQGRLLGNITATRGVISRTMIDCQNLAFHPKRLLLACTSATGTHLFQS